MAHPESDSESPSSHSPADGGEISSGADWLREVAHVAPVHGALAEVELPTPLRGLQEGVASPYESVVPTPGAVIAGRYRLDRVLGSGGMGVVFAAHHLQTDKPVALKWLSLSRRQRGSRDRAQALARFAREARAAGRIRHPNVVDVYDASSDEATPYLVMERLEGETLRARIERAPLSWDELIALLVPAMRGVVELHRQGIIHRDLKPDNVFLAREPDTQQPCAKVLDFGVSLLRSVDALEESLTGTGAIVGTPSYMPLEQLRGDDSVDARTDVYALGVVLFEALTGRRPWQARSAAEYGALLASARPTRLSSLRPELKGAREAAIMKALERNPGDRHESVEAFIAALLDAAKPRAQSRLRWAIALGAVALAVALLVGLHRKRAPIEARIAEPVQSRPAPAQPAAAVLPPAAPAVEPVVVAPAATPAASPTSSRGARVARSRRVAPAPKAEALPPPAASPQRELEVVEPPPQPVSLPTDRAVSLTRDEF